MLDADRLRSSNNHPLLPCGFTVHPSTSAHQTEQFAKSNNSIFGLKYKFQIRFDSSYHFSRLREPLLLAPPGV